MFYRIILNSLLLLCFQNSLAAMSPVTQMVKKTMAKFMRETQAPGAAVVIVRDGKSEIYVFGNADLKKKIPVTPQTIFEVGSITKVFTSILLADAANQNHLQLSDSISHHLPNVESNWVLRRITLEQLATHTGGFPFKTPDSLKTSKDLEQYLLKWQPEPAMVPTFQYSNPSIGLLGIILEKNYHRDINQLYLERILLPLQMSAIGLTVPANLTPLYAQGYSRDGKSASHMNNGIFPAAGSLKLSPEDLAKFLNASLGLPGTPKALKNAIQLSQTPRVQVGEMQQALGWQVRPFTDKNALIKNTNVVNIEPTPFKILPKEFQKFNPNALIEKTGGADGFRTYIALIPNSRTGVAIVVNRFVETAPIVSAARTFLFQNYDDKKTSGSVMRDKLIENKSADDEILCFH